MPQPRIAVVGAGVTGLTAAEAIAGAGASVTVLEAGGTAGGQVRTVSFEDRDLDVGAEALHLAGPHLTGLLDRLDLTRRLVHAAPGETWVWTRHGLRRLPSGVGPAGPTRLAPVVRSRILGPVALARAALEPLVPARSRIDAGADMSVGEYLSHRFGRELVDALVDPVLGTLHAGDVDRLSLLAATPYLAAQATAHRSLLLARRGRSSAAPTFATLEGGLEVLVGALVDAVTAGSGEVHLGSAVRSISPSGSEVEVETSAGSELFDGAVLAVPAHVAARVLEAPGKPAPPGLESLRSTSVVTVLASYPRAAVARSVAAGATGLLVPSWSGLFLKAATFLTNKWPHLDRGDDRFLVRMSAGRIDDADPTGMSDVEIVERLHLDLATATGIATGPDATLVERWPRTMAQLEVGHRGRVDAASRFLDERGRVVLAGAPYDGVGIAACVRSGTEAARRLLAATASVVAA